MDDFESTVLCKNALEKQLEKAKDSLKNVDENLKKFISRNLDEQPPFTRLSGFNKNAPRNTTVLEKRKVFKHENIGINRRRPLPFDKSNIENDTPVKRRLGPKVVHSSITGPPKPSDPEPNLKKPSVSSYVVAKPLVLPSRKEAMSVQTYSVTRARDRRMFGSLLGTLQRFQKDEIQLKDKEEKKAKVEKKLEEAAKREKETIRQERQKLISLRKKQESYIRAVEQQIKLVKSLEEWEQLQQPLFNYIQTHTKPSICYLPKVHNEKTKELLKQCQETLHKRVENKRNRVSTEAKELLAKWENTPLMTEEVDQLTTECLATSNGNVGDEKERVWMEEEERKETMPDENEMEIEEPVTIKQEKEEKENKEEKEENEEKVEKEEKEETPSPSSESNTNAEEDIVNVEAEISDVNDDQAEKEATSPSDHVEDGDNVNVNGIEEKESDLNEPEQNIHELNNIEILNYCDIPLPSDSVES